MKSFHKLFFENLHNMSAKHEDWEGINGFIRNKDKENINKIKKKIDDFVIHLHVLRDAVTDNQESDISNIIQVMQTDIEEIQNQIYFYIDNGYSVVTTHLRDYAFHHLVEPLNDLLIEFPDLVKNKEFFDLFSSIHHNSRLGFGHDHIPNSSNAEVYLKNSRDVPKDSKLMKHGLYDNFRTIKKDDKFVQQRFDTKENRWKDNR